MLRKSNIHLRASLQAGRRARLQASLLAGLWLLATTADAALRCDSGLVDTGDSYGQVRERCGEPDYMDRAPAQPGYGTIALSQIEIWYYNFGPSRLLYLLEFRAGRLQTVTTDGYGFDPPWSPSCDPNRLATGTSSYRVLAFCGEPAERNAYTVNRPVEIGGQIYGQEVIVYEEWTYDFGPARLRRVLIIENGRIRDVRTEGYGH